MEELRKKNKENKNVFIWRNVFVFLGCFFFGFYINSWALSHLAVKAQTLRHLLPLEKAKSLAWNCFIKAQLVTLSQALSDKLGCISDSILNILIIADK